MIFDTHVHTKYSSDSKMELADALQRASEMGIGIITTEHIDLFYPKENMFLFDIKDYFARYGDLRSDKYLLGVELGMLPGKADANRQLVADEPFDYVIGSIHMVDGYDIYYKDFYDGKTREEAYQRYFLVMLDCLREYNFIDALGHIDYIARYAHYADRALHYELHHEIIDEILRTAVQKGVLMEINSRRLNDKAAVNELLPIYERYYELGGRYAVIGSDAHKKEAVGSSLELAAGIAETCRLEVGYFKERSFCKC